MYHSTCQSVVQILQLHNSILTCKVTRKRVNRVAGECFGDSGHLHLYRTEEKSSLDSKKYKWRYQNHWNIFKKSLKWNSQLLFFPCPLIRKKFRRKSSFGAKKICSLIGVSANCLSTFWDILYKNLNVYFAGAKIFVLWECPLIRASNVLVYVWSIVVKLSPPITLTTTLCITDKKRSEMVGVTRLYSTSNEDLEFF